MALESLRLAVLYSKTLMSQTNKKELPVTYLCSFSTEFMRGGGSWLKLNNIEMGSDGICNLFLIL